MKKLLALTMALVLACGLSMTAMAVGPAVTENGGTGTMKASYTQKSEFLIAIPDTITVGDTNAQIIDAQNVRINYNQTLKVSVSSEDWKLKLENSTNDTLAYHLVKSASNINGSSSDNDKVVLTIESGTTTGKQALTAELDSGVAAKKSGTYTDTLTFTVKVE